MTTDNNAALDGTILGVVLEQATARDIYDPAAVAALIDRDLLIYDDDGHPLNILEALDTLLENKPYLCDLDHYKATQHRGPQSNRTFKPMRIGWNSNPRRHLIEGQRGMPRGGK